MSDTFEVTVKKIGLIHGRTPKIGEKIFVTEQEFSKNWMVKGDYEAPKPIDNSKATCAEDIEHEPLEIPSLMNKPKRKRRTPAEMAAAREEEAKKEK